MLEVSAATWAATIALIGLLLVLDLVVSQGRSRAVAFGEAAAWSAFYVTVAVVFGVGLAALGGWDLAVQYFAGYLVEKTLSVDNLFVFMIAMRTFAVPAEYEHRVLTFGILGSLVMRAFFIVVGAALIEAFSITFLLFGALLIVTAVQLFRHRNEDPSVEDNIVIALARRALPITDRYDDGRLITRTGNRRMLTPLFLVLIAIASTDMVFALDSIPAVFGVTEDPYIVFAANAFALLGLRALYFLVDGLLDRLVHLATGLSLILTFIGAKMVLHFLHGVNPSVPEVSPGLSLVVIVVVLTATIAASLVRSRRDPSARPHAGALRAPRGMVPSATARPPAPE